MESFVKESNRVYLPGPDGPLAQITFPQREETSVVIESTFVDGSLRGQGVAGQLMEAALAVIESRGQKAVPRCSYALDWFLKHPEKKNLMLGKTTAQSHTQQVQIIMNEHINGFSRLFGGQLVEWIDIVAVAVARRHSNQNVTTVCIDHLDFKQPAHVNDTIVLDGRLTYVGRTSMEVRVDTYVEALEGQRTLINTAYLVLVALDEKERPSPVPPLLLVDEAERAQWEAGKKRCQMRRQRP